MKRYDESAVAAITWIGAGFFISPTRTTQTGGGKPSLYFFLFSPPVISREIFVVATAGRRLLLLRSKIAAHSGNLSLHRRYNERFCAASFRFETGGNLATNK